ncbi:MAG: tetratricopeptide repeat protein [Chitinophagaceae bacterium]
MIKIACSSISFLLILVSINAQQKTKPIASGVLLENGVKLHDEKKYKDAIEEFKKINRNDTNYSTALHELSLSYYSDSNFAESKKAAETGLKFFPEDKNKWYNLIANAEDELGNFDAAVANYDKIIANDENNYLAYFNKGIVYYRKEKYNEASKFLKQCLIISPFYTSAHYFLGRISIEQGKPVQALFAFCTNLLLNPDNKYAGSAVTNLLAIANTSDEVSKKINNNFGDEDNFAEQQEILLSKIALDKKYKPKSSLDDNVVKQIQVVMEKTSFVETDKGFYNQFYVPIFEQIFKQDFEKFTYFMFSGLNSKSIADYVKRNKKDLIKFSDDNIYTYFNEIRETRTLEFNKRASVTKRYYNNESGIAIIGTKKQVGKEINFVGNTQFFYNNGQLKSEGSFNEDGKRIGTWKFYHENGVLNETNNYDNGKVEGEIKTYFDNGVQSSVQFYKNDKAEGKFTNWFYNGSLRKQGFYENDKINGQLKTYSIRGLQEFEGGVKNDEYDGDFKTYHPNGVPKIISTYNAGKQNGLYKEYFYNGNIYFTGNLENGEKQGVWKEYYFSGKQKAILNYLKGEMEGEQIYYHENGKIEKKITYLKNKAEGKCEEFYEDGKIFCETIFEKGRLREITFYNAKGEAYSNTTSKRGDANLIFYNYNGNKTSEGFFTKEGFRNGKTTFYYNNGKIKSEEEYKNGELQGLKTTYFKNGSKQSEVNFEQGYEDGHYVVYNRNNTIKEEGFFENGEKQGEFRYYDDLGKLEKIVFYLNDDDEGFVEYYHPNGKIDYEEQTLNGWFTRIIQYDTLGKIIEEQFFPKGEGSFTLKNYNGNPKIKTNVKNNFINGSYKYFYSNNQIQIERFYKNGFADSIFKSYHLNGKLNLIGSYVTGEKHGIWKTYYPDGKLSHEETYELGDLNGVSKVYHEFDGSIQKEIQYKNGNVHGTFKQYGEAGNLAYVLNFEDGYLTSYSYEGKDGKLIPAIELKSATGKIISYYKNGTKSAEIDYDDNIIHGNRNIYFSNGKPFIISERAYGEETKTKKVFYPNGNLESEENHFQDAFHGSCKYYYANGKIKAEENYYLGNLHGICKYYDETNGKETIRTYFYGELIK